VIKNWELHEGKEENEGRAAERKSVSNGKFLHRQEKYPKEKTLFRRIHWKESKRDPDVRLAEAVQFLFRGLKQRWTGDRLIPGTKGGGWEVTLHRKKGGSAANTREYLDYLRGVGWYRGRGARQWAFQKEWGEGASRLGLLIMHRGRDGFSGGTTYLLGYKAQTRPIAKRLWMMKMVRVAEPAHVSPKDAAQRRRMRY